MLFAATAFLAGCAGMPSKSLSGADRTAMKSIRIDPQVHLPNEIFYSGRGQSWAAVGGIVGELGRQHYKEESGMALASKMQERNISLPEILKQEFSRALENGGAVRLVKDDAPADGTLKLTVNTYGFAQTQGASALQYPILNVKASLTSNDGKLVWQQTDYVSPFNAENKQGYEFKRYMAEPELLQTVWTTVTGIASRRLAKDLQR